MTIKLCLKYKILSKLRPQILSSIKSVFIFGTTDVMFITNDDKVYGLGDNYFGYLGLRHINAKRNIKMISELCDKHIIKIDWTYNRFGIGLTKSGRLYEWGYIDGKSGYENPRIIDRLQGIRVIQMSCGYNETLVLTESGEVYTFNHSYNILNAIEMNIFKNKKIIAISSGFQHYLAVSESGEVFVWGQNFYGQLGLGHYKRVICATKIHSLENVFVRKICCGLNHSLVLTTDGQIYSFGSNNLGQLGIGDKTDRNEPMLILNSHKFVDIFADSKTNISMALSDNQMIYVWGECNEEVIESPLKTNFTSFQDSINKYSKILFTHKLIPYSELFSGLNPGLNQMPDRLVRVMANSFDNPNYSDLKFEIKENNEIKYIFVHKWFVEENSKFLKTLFANKLSENDKNVIEIKDHSYKAYYEYIRFLYTDSIASQELEVLIELLDIANEYSDEDLKHKCSQSIKALINVENVCDIYSAAVKYICDDLEKCCFDFMLNITNVLIKTKSYEQMDPIYVKHFNTKYFEYINK